MPKTLPLALLSCAALAAAAQVPLPLPLIHLPVSLPSAVVCFTALAVGPAIGSLAVVLYLAVGAAGLPILGPGLGGLEVLRGPEGGYLLGLLVVPTAVVLTRAVLGSRAVGAMLSTLAGHGVMLSIAVLWMHEAQQWSWFRTLEVGAWPYLPGAVFKSVLVGALAAWVQAPSKR